MKKNMIKLAAGTAAVLLMATSAQATLKTDKVTLKGNMQVKYNKLPAPVDSLGEAFTEGMFYGRFRTNFFYWDWDKEDYATGGKQKDNKNNGIGGSLIYKTAPFKGVSATVGMYTSQNLDFFRMDKQDAAYAKSGKDTFSRYDLATGGHYGMTVLGLAYLQYDASKKTSVKLGRQMFETVFTKSNDTKMIPNTFDGATVVSKDLPKTTVKLAYFTKQKLRDHTSEHDVLAYDPTNSGNQNDDSAINKNLTVARIGTNNKLIVGSVTNKSIKNLKANVSYATVPGVVSNLTLEAHYTIPVGSMKIVPGVRYMMQYDNLNANFGVANLGGNQTGYANPNSLDSNLLCARVDFKQGAFLGRLGYSKVADKADIIAPWRGFPTGGYTRAMAQYNWYANTKSYMIRAGYDFGKANILPGFSAMVRYVIQDYDETKTAVRADSTVIHMDLRQNIGQSSELKFRLGMVDTDIKAGKDGSYNEYRLEYNFFF
ncbi:OprD family outer membrane porin [Sulfurimonas sp.]|uniref:OprD family outer membrane porin n=1 Tax=Sulfurimonas sp. TaxID=2022749 RepID=UPI00262DB472|nr:OprD family outer membrane porin [Sulfurimonas sp.]